MKPLLDIRAELFDLKQIITAVWLHKTSPYDAWTYNFKLRIGDLKGKSVSDVSMLNLALKNISLTERIQKIDFICYAMSKSNAMPNSLDGIKFLINEFLVWRNTKTNKEFPSWDLCEVDQYCGLPRILEKVRSGMLPEIEAAEIITNKDAWSKIYGLRETFDFSFEQIWNRVYFLKPVVERKQREGI